MKTLNRIWNWLYYVPATILFIISFVAVTLKYICRWLSMGFNMLDKGIMALVELLKDRFYYIRRNLSRHLIAQLVDVPRSVLTTPEKMRIVNLIAKVVGSIHKRSDFKAISSLITFTNYVHVVMSTQIEESDRRLIDILRSAFLLKSSKIPNGLKISIISEIRQYGYDVNTSTIKGLEDLCNYVERHHVNLPKAWTAEEGCTLNDLIPSGMTLPDYAVNIITIANNLYFGEEKMVNENTSITKEEPQNTDGSEVKENK